ncbi:MAG: hypothetical protein HQ581_11820, partial [Planctomycetes bacterium]|nr:hypothetical protein [Planctomycetota bacterium]
LLIGLLLVGTATSAGENDETARAKGENRNPLEYIELKLAPDVTMGLVKVRPGRFLMGSDPDQQVRLHDDREQYTLVARLRLFDDKKTAVWSHPALVKGRLYIRNENSIHCLLLP